MKQPRNLPPWMDEVAWKSATAGTALITAVRTWRVKTDSPTAASVEVLGGLLVVAGVGLRALTHVGIIVTERKKVTRLWLLVGRSVVLELLAVALMLSGLLLADHEAAKRRIMLGTFSYLVSLVVFSYTLQGNENIPNGAFWLRRDWGKGKLTVDGTKVIRAVKWVAPPFQAMNKAPRGGRPGPFSQTLAAAALLVTLGSVTSPAAKTDTRLITVAVTQNLSEVVLPDSAYVGCSTYANVLSALKRGADDAEVESLFRTWTLLGSDLATCVSIPLTKDGFTITWFNKGKAGRGAIVSRAGESAYFTADQFGILDQLAGLTRVGTKTRAGLGTFSVLYDKSGSCRLAERIDSDVGSAVILPASVSNVALRHTVKRLAIPFYAGITFGADGVRKYQFVEVVEDSHRPLGMQTNTTFTVNYLPRQGTATLGADRAADDAPCPAEEAEMTGVATAIERSAQAAQGG